MSIYTPIYAIHKSIRYEGYLDANGHFNLYLGNAFKPFTSFATSASFVCKKPVQKGWEFWFSLDEHGNEQDMAYFLKQLKP